MCELRRRIRKEAQNCPILNYLFSTQRPIKDIKIEYGLDDRTLCLILKDMLANGEIRDFGIRYSEWNPEVISFYWFK